MGEEWLFLKRANKKTLSETKKTNDLQILHPPAASPSPFSLKHASFPALPCKRLNAPVWRLWGFGETVHKMQSQISILRDKPTMYLNVLLLLNNWENFKVWKMFKKDQKKKKKKKSEHYRLHQISYLTGQKGCTYTLPLPQHSRRFFFPFLSFFFSFPFLKS